MIWYDLASLGLVLFALVIVVDLLIRFINRRY